MAGESALARRSSFPLVLGLLLVFLILLAGFGAWGVREVYYQGKDLEKLGLIAHTWMYSDPQIAKELGTATMTTGVTDAIEESRSHRTAHVRYHVTGSKSGGDVEIWLKQYRGASWTVTGAILTTADKRMISIGSPLDPVGVAGKKD